jgi:hypothetical protein
MQMTPATEILRRQVIAGYGGKCVECGEDDPVVLELDHIEGGGNDERKKVRGKYFYDKLIQQNFPSGYQILCANDHRRKTRGNNGVLKRGARDEQVDQQPEALNGELPDFSYYDRPLEDEKPLPRQQPAKPRRFRWLFR